MISASPILLVRPAVLDRRRRLAQCMQWSGQEIKVTNDKLTLISKLPNLNKFFTEAVSLILVLEIYNFRYKFIF